MIDSILIKFQTLSSKINSMKTAFTVVSNNISGGFAGASGGGLDFSSYPSGGDFFADGGAVPGSGDGDSVPAMLTPGEFVVSKPAVQTFGEGFFHMVNKMKSFTMPKFNMGGFVQSFASGGAVRNNSMETMTLNLQIGSVNAPLQVLGNTNTMRQTVRMLERELSKMRLSHA